MSARRQHAPAGLEPLVREFSFGSVTFWRARAPGRRHLAGRRCGGPQPAARSQWAGARATTNCAPPTRTGAQSGRGNKVSPAPRVVGAASLCARARRRSPTWCLFLRARPRAGPQNKLGVRHSAPARRDKNGADSLRAEILIRDRSPTADDRRARASRTQCKFMQMNLRRAARWSNK